MLRWKRALEPFSDGHSGYRMEKGTWPLTSEQGDFEERLPMDDFGTISLDLYRQLTRIAPSPSVGGLYPCRVITKSGKTIDRVFMSEVPADWCPAVLGPEFRVSMRGLERESPLLPVEDIASIEESPYRLSPRLVAKLHESGMGFCIYTLVFSDGQRHTHLSLASWMDFTELPEGMTGSDVIDAISEPRGTPYEGEGSKPYDCICFFRPPAVTSD